MDDIGVPFDFEAHAERAVTQYLQVQGFYNDLAQSLRRIIEEALIRKSIKVHSVQARSKDPASFTRKVARPSESDPTKPKYGEPLTEITDLAAVRVITYFPGTLAGIDEVVRSEFDVLERSDKGQALVDEERFGYQSIHYLVRIKPNRAQLPEYGRFRDAVAEVQVRTILQHAWAEIEHDIQYKAASVIPAEIRRRFMSLAGMLEVADREFQTIQDLDAVLSADARTKVSQGQFEEVEITPDAVKTYLDGRLGPDGRISSWSYNWIAGLLRRLGFTTIRQVDDAIHQYNDDRLSYVASGARQGQTTRFEFMLLAALGEEYIKRHSFAPQPWFGGRQRELLNKFASQGIPIATYDPLRYEQPPNPPLQPTTQADAERRG